jgi:ribosomal protein L23
MMMIVAARREITKAIQSGFGASVNVNSVQNLCARGGQMKNFWGLSRKSADNPVTSKIPLDLHCWHGAS